MKKWFLSFLPIILFLLAAPIDAQEHKKVDYPGVPRVPVYEAYVKYKAGKALILHAGGEAYKLRHIVGAFNMEKYNDSILLKFPKKGIEIFTYCY